MSSGATVGFIKAHMHLIKEHPENPDIVAEALVKCCKEKWDAKNSAQHAMKGGTNRHGHRDDITALIGFLNWKTEVIDLTKNSKKDKKGKKGKSGSKGKGLDAKADAKKKGKDKGG